MPYGTIAVTLAGRRLRLDIELPERGEPSDRGSADNLVDPTRWLRIVGPTGEIAAKLVICQPYRQRTRTDRSASRRW